MSPSVYSYTETYQGFELYLGNSSTIFGLSLLLPSTGLRVKSFGATSYKNFGWATEKDIPAFKSVSELSDFLNSQQEIGLIDIEIELNGVGTLSTHDDSECHFKLNSNILLNTLLSRAAPLPYRDKIIHEVVTNPRLYISCDEAGNIAKYASFKSYLSKNT